MFKAGGIYTHGTGFGSTISYGLHTDIYGIDWDGATNYTITGESKDPNHSLINAPTNHEYKSSEGNNNAFVANIKTNDTVDFSYYISSIETVGGLAVFGGSDESEFAGKFDVNSVNDAGPPLSISKENEINNDLIIYPNPLSKGDLYLSVNREQIKRVVIYSIDGKTILDINQIDIRHVNIDKLTNGTYIVTCQTNSGLYNSKFIKN